MSQTISDPYRTSAATPRAGNLFNAASGHDPPSPGYREVGSARTGPAAAATAKVVACLPEPLSTDCLQNRSTWSSRNRRSRSSVEIEGCPHRGGSAYSPAPHVSSSGGADARSSLTGALNQAGDKGASGHLQRVGRSDPCRRCSWITGSSRSPEHGRRGLHRLAKTVDRWPRPPSSAR